MTSPFEEVKRIRAVARNEVYNKSGGVSRLFLNMFLKSLYVFSLVFLAVLALHVLIIGGFTLYHLLKS